MSLPQHILYRQGGTVWIDVLDKPANGQVSGYMGDGSEVFAGRTCTLSTIATTLNAAVSRGALSINVNSNTGFAVGGKFWLQDDPEEALCQKVASATVTLRRPLTRDHVVGATIEGTRVSYACNATDAVSTFWDGHLDWNLGGVIAEQSCFECTKFFNERRATVQDLYDEDPQFYNLWDPKMDLERALDLAHDDVLGLVAIKPSDQRARVAPASREFIKATVFQFFHRLYRPRAGNDNVELAKSYRAQAIEEVDRMCLILPRDADQDGVVEANEKVAHGTVRLRRA